MKIERLFYDVVSTGFGSMAIVWWNSASGPRVRQVFLCGKKAAAKVVRSAYPDVQPCSCPSVAELGRRMKRFLAGEAVVFDLELIAMEACGGFQRKVLLAEYGIPRGRISTYGRIAKHIGVPEGGRAAGRALATNPFPIVIPCHRAVRADGGLGGYQGGRGMKRALLEMEGVEFAANGKVRMERVFY